MRLEFNPRAFCYNLYCETKEEERNLKKIAKDIETNIKSLSNVIYSDTDSIKIMKTKLNSIYGRMYMELQDTINEMCSKDYKERFKAEYWQTKIRYKKLHAMIVKYEAGTLNFEPSCSLELLKSQASNMGQYLYTLEVRAQIEHIDL